MSQFTEILQILHDHGVMNKHNKRMHVASMRRVQESEQVLEAIKKATPFLRKEATIRDRLYCIKYERTWDLSCKTCGTYISIENKHPHTNFCSSACQNSNNEKKLKAKNTLKEKYGVEHNSQLESVKQSKIQNSLEKFGTQSVLQSQEVKNKIKDTMVERYGVQHALQSVAVRDDMKKRSLEKYGVDSPNKLRRKKQKAKNTLKEKYGVEHNSQLDSVKKSKISSNLEKYGVPFYSQKHLTPEAVKHFSDDEWLREQVSKQHPIIVAKTLGVSESAMYWRLNKAGIDFDRSNRVSVAEKELADWVKSVSKYEVLTSFKFQGNSEIDIYIPHLELGIEYNGLYWHSENQGRERSYHLGKKRRCQALGIDLVQINSNDLELSEDVVKSRILTRLGLSKRVGARTCDVKILSTDEYREFFTKTHLHGYVPAHRCYGLVKDGKILMAVSVGKPRFSSDFDLEVLRMSGELQTVVVGGLGKLLARIKQDFQGLRLGSYVDRRWSEGNFYLQLGFRFQKETPPGYVYYKSPDYTTAHSRQKFQKHKLPKLLETFDPNLTEWQNMQANGYDRVWDCGNNLYTIKL